VHGAGVIINCSTSTKGDAESTGNLVTAAAGAGLLLPGHGEPVPGAPAGAAAQARSAGAR
jgi:hypothetical protein